MATPCLSDSGLETWLVFHRDVDLPEFASFPLLEHAEGRALLGEYFRDHLAVAAAAGAGIVLETPTWRANAVWGARLGYDAVALDRINREAVTFVRSIADEFAGLEVIVSGNLGPRGDGYNYVHAERLSPGAGEEYHRTQIASLAAGGADRITMLTATHPGEAIGVVRAGAAVRLPVVVAFTVETDGRLPNEQPLHEAIAEVDAETDAAALYYGINCAHPDHFSGALTMNAAATERIGLLRANASRASHAELDEAETLDDGDPAELGSQNADLLRRYPHLQVLGGCCGTDVRHVAAIANACLA